MRRLLQHFANRTRSGRRGNPPPRRVCPAVELLEDRAVPATFNVNSLADLGIAGGVNRATGAIVGQGNTVTLRSAIDAANRTPGGNTIRLTLPGTYRIAQAGANTGTDLTGAFAILPGGGNLSIVNASAGAVTVDGNHLDRVFDINPTFDPANPTPAYTVTLQGFTITGGVASPGDGAAGSGGGIRDQGNASLTLTNVVVTNNLATADGGGVAMENTISVPWKLTVNNSTISNNHAGDAGGGIETDGSSKVFVNAGTVITGNTCVNQGGGVWLDAILVGNTFQAATLTVTGTLIANNAALTGPGGGIGNAGNGGVALTSSTLANNFTAGTGGGFADTDNQGTLAVTSSLILGNLAAGSGGGLQEGGPSTTITTTEIKANASGTTGGGLFANGSALSILRSTIANNLAGADGNGNGGGGLELQTTGPLTITDDTITGNRALNSNGSNGGGLDLGRAFNTNVTLVNDTITANFANLGGGVFWAGAQSRVNVENTIIALNYLAAQGAGSDANGPGGPFVDLGGNLIGVAGDANAGFGTAASTQTGTLAHPLNPLLAALGYYGGPTVGAPGASLGLETEQPLSGSPAHGKGLKAGAPATDERGVAITTTVPVGAVNH